MADSDPLWYKDAVIYQAHVRSFFDSSGDGIGDFRGLTQNLDYVQDLGATCIWLLPFFPSPLKDDGYDVADYENVHPAYGTLEDCQAFIDAAHARSIKVLFELVVNHTSDQHPWFQAARQAPPGSRAREFYVWSDTDQKFPETRVIFCDTEKSNWTYDPVAGAYYWHRFFSHQPDLNHNNPDVVEAMVKVMRFWLDRGVDALRLDAVPYLCVREGTTNESLPETHAVLKRMRRELDERYPNRMLLAEANQWPADVREFFGDGDECHMGFHFPLMPRMFMALRQEDRHPITEILRQTPEIPDTCQWALFLRNHDELTLELVTDEERDYMYQTYATDPQMRLNLGIRRRLAPLLENSRRQVELLNSLLFSLPGTPIIYYGDEIGMGDNIYLGDRNGVRTPMQWSGDRNGGFSRADPARLYAPPIMDPVYGYQAINVEAQQRYSFSPLNWMKRMIALRRQHQTFGRGTLEFLHPKNRKVLAYIRRHDHETILCVANLSRSVQPVELDLSVFRGLTPIEMLGLAEFPRIDGDRYFFTLSPYAFYWFALQEVATSITARTAPPIDPRQAEVEALPALFAGGVWETMLDGNVRRFLEKEALQPFLERQRASEPGDALRHARIADWTVLRKGTAPAFLAIIEAEHAEGPIRFALPLALATGNEADAELASAPGAVMARITGARKGVLYDGLRDPEMKQILLGFIDRGGELATRSGVIRGSSFGLRESSDGPLHAATRGHADQASVSPPDRVNLKFFRRVQPGPNPEIEIARYLVETRGFLRVPQVLGALEYQRGTDAPGTLAAIRQAVAHQGNGWDRTIDELGRYFERSTSHLHEPVPAPSHGWFPAALDPGDAEPPPLLRSLSGGYLEAAATLGRRTAELHLALVFPTTDPAFAPEAVTTDELRRSSDEMVAHAGDVLARLDRSQEQLPEATRPLASLLLERRHSVARHLNALSDRDVVASRIRCHNDYHLGQVLWTEQDFVIVNVEAEPAGSLEYRRLKRSPLRDVASMLRSLSFATWAALLAFTTTHPEDEATLQPWARLWETWSTAAFLRAYRETAAGASFLPADSDHYEGLLRTFMLDKALHELDYELTHRRDRVRVPLRGALSLIV